MEAELLAQVKALDPAPQDAAMPAGAWSTAVVLQDIERRMGMDPRETTLEDTPDRVRPAGTRLESVRDGSLRRLRQPGRRRERGPLVAAAAALVVLLAGLGTWMAISDPDDPAADPLAIGVDYIETFNRGEAAGVLALLAPDATLSEFYPGMGSGFNPIEREFYEQQLAWETAQGTVFVSPACVVTGAAPDGGSTVVCEFGWHPIVEQTIGAPPIPTILTLGVGSAGIDSLAFEYPPDFTPGGWDEWLASSHPDDVNRVNYGDWVSVADAERGGLLRAQYAQEWAAYLEANSCVFESGFDFVRCE